MVLSILVIEDLAMAAYLPLVTGLLLGGGLLASALPVGVALATVALVLLVALRYGETLSRLVFSPSDEVLLLVILGLALVVAGLIVLIFAGMGRSLLRVFHGEPGPAVNPKAENLWLLAGPIALTSARPLVCRSSLSAST